jgi:hypothetical protein
MSYFILNCSGRRSKLISTFRARGIFHLRDEFSSAVGGCFRMPGKYVVIEEQIKCELFHEIFSP